MKSNSLLKAVFFVLCFVGTTTNFANADASKKVSPKKLSSTNVEFDDLLVKGKYHFSDEAVVTVEEDKVLDALLGIRKNFKDRMQRSAEIH